MKYQRAFIIFRDYIVHPLADRVLDFVMLFDKESAELKHNLSRPEMDSEYVFYEK